MVARDTFVPGSIFSLIPNRFTPTKLDQKWEKQPKPMKTMFNSWVTEKAKIWRYILALLDPIWLYLKNYAPILQGWKPFSAVCTQLLRVAYILYVIKDYFKIPYISLSSWNDLFFLKSSIVRIIFYYFEVYWRGIYSQGIPHIILEFMIYFVEDNLYRRGFMKLRN